MERYPSFFELDADRLQHITPDLVFSFLLACGIEPTQANVDYVWQRIFKFAPDPASGLASRWIDLQ